MAGLLSGGRSDCPSAELRRQTSLGLDRKAGAGSVVRRTISGASAPLADPAAVERDDLAPRRSVGALPRRSVRALLGKFLGNPQQPLAAFHLHPHVLGMDAGGDPEHDEIVEKVGAFAHHGFAIAV